MRKHICVLLSVYWWSWVGFAQNNPCIEKLKTATRAYDEGRVNEVAAHLKECLEQLNKERRKEAYKLLVLSYMYLDEVDNVTKYMKKYLKLTRKLTKQKVRYEGMTEFERVYRKYNTDPVFWYGISLGATYNKAKATKTCLPVGFTNPGKYTPASGTLVGLMFGISLSHSVWLGTELNYDLQQFGYVSTNASTEVSIVEKRHLLRVPVYARYFLRNHWKKIRPFVSLGFWGNHLLLSQTKFHQTNAVGQQTQSFDMMNHRARWEAGAMLGVGVLLKIKNIGILSLDFRYKPGFTNIVKPNQRLEQPGYKDDDMMVNVFSVSLGFCLPVYNVQMKKEYRNPLSKNQ